MQTKPTVSIEAHSNTRQSFEFSNRRQHIYLYVNLRCHAYHGKRKHTAVYQENVNVQQVPLNTQEIQNKRENCNEKQQYIQLNRVFYISE